MKIYIIDLYSVIFRSYYAIRNLTSSSGFPTNAIFGTFKTIFKIIKNFNADNIIIVADTGKKTFRHKIYKEYKANRLEAPDDLKMQFSVIKEIINKMNFYLIEKQEYEADDLIYSLTKDFSGNNDEVFIYTSDKDLYQLTSDNVSIITESKKHGTIIAGPAETIAKFGVTPKQILDYLALTGDKSDNIPGVKGIGDKTAIQLLSEYKNIDEIYNNIDNIKRNSLKNKLFTGKDNAYLSKELATLKYIDLSAEISCKNLNKYDISKAVDLFKKYELNTLITDISKSYNYSLFDIPQPQNDTKEQFNNFNPLILSAEDLTKQKIEDFCLNKKIIFCYEEIHNDEYIIISNFKEFLIIKNNNIYNTKKIIKDFISFTSNFIFYDIKKFFKKFCFDYSYDELKNLISHSFIISLASYLIDSDELNISFERLVNKYKNKNYYYDIKNKKTPASEILKYYQFLISEMDGMDEILFNKLEDLKLIEVYTKIEIPLIIVLLKMELLGIRVDKNYLNELHKKLNNDVNIITEKIIEYTGANININSSKQLSVIFFDKLGLPPVKKIKTGYSTDNEVLEKLSDIHPLPKLILDYRTLTKLINTYTSNYIKFEQAGRIHTNFNQCVTTTGRLSCSEPNLQNIPVESEDHYSIRKIFIADEGCQLVSADYSQIELRILAHLSGDENMIEAFNNDEDIHDKTAKEIFGSLLPITSHQRRIAKTVNFAIIYGMSAFSLSKDLNIMRKDADRYIKKYFERYPKIRIYLDSIISFVKETGYVETMFGRKRFIKTINDRNKNIRNSAERMAINMPVQGTAADVMKYAMISIDKKLKNYKTKMCLSVHDELVFNTPVDEIEDLKEIIHSGMSGVVKLKVPLKVDIKIGKSWT